jgi:hypothetical protein
MYSCSQSLESSRPIQSARLVLATLVPWIDPKAASSASRRCALGFSSRSRDLGRCINLFPVVRSNRLDIPSIAFELHFGDGVERHAHLLEPSRDSIFAGRFHDADGFALGQIGKAAITFDGRILLCRLRKLLELVGGEFSGRNCVCAHELCHNTSFSLSFCCFLETSRRDEISWWLHAPKLRLSIPDNVQLFGIVFHSRMLPKSAARQFTACGESQFAC